MARFLEHHEDPESLQRYLAELHEREAERLRQRANDDRALFDFGTAEVRREAARYHDAAAAHHSAVADELRDRARAGLD